MNHELEEQAVMVTLKAADMTIAGLKNMITALLEKRKTAAHGEQALRKLNLQNMQLENVEMPNQDMKDFRRHLKKYSVDFAIMKDRKSREHTAFFKAQDVNRIYAGLERCVKDLGFDMSERRPIDEVMADARERAAQRNEQQRNERQKQPEQNRAYNREREV